MKPGDRIYDLDAWAKGVLRLGTVGTVRDWTGNRIDPDYGQWVKWDDGGRDMYDGYEESRYALVTEEVAVLPNRVNWTCLLPELCTPEQAAARSLTS